MMGDQTTDQFVEDFDDRRTEVENYVAWHREPGHSDRFLNGGDAIVDDEADALVDKLIEYIENDR